MRKLSAALSYAGRAYLAICGILGAYWISYPVVMDTGGFAESPDGRYYGSHVRFFEERITHGGGGKGFTVGGKADYSPLNAFYEPAEIISDAIYKRFFELRAVDP